MEDGAALDYAAIGSEDQGHGAEHEHYGAPGGGFGQHIGCAARAEGGLAACSAEGAGEVGGFAALQQHYNDEDQAIEDEKSGQKPSGKAEDFLTGFIANLSENKVRGRPVGVFVLHDGSVLVTDDMANTIWKVQADPK